jgi:hypothetical protein
MMRIYFEHLANQSIYLRLNLPEDHEENLPDAEDEENVSFKSSNIAISSVFQFILKEHPTRLRALFINEFSREWSTLFIQHMDFTAGLPNLEWIHIGWNQAIYLDGVWNEEHTPLPATLVPRLTKLSLAQTTSTFLIPSDHITNLHLEDIAIDRCFEVIVLCTNIVECRIIPHSASDPDKEPPSDPVTRSRTTCLGWAFGLEDWDIAFLKYFTFPALERFRCEDQGSDGFEDSDIGENIRLLQKQFLSRCPRLTVFERVAEESVNWSLQELCDDLPNTIEELYIHYFKIEAEDVFSKLARGDDWSTGKFPRLMVLELEGEFWNEMGKAFPSLVTMLESRRRPIPEQHRNHARVERVELRCSTEDQIVPNELTEEQKDRLQGFVNEGLRLTTSGPQGKRIIWSPTRL